MTMHAVDNDPRRLLVLKLTAEGMTLAAQRDLVEYWGRRKAEGRPTDWT